MAFNKSRKRLRWTRQRYLREGGRKFLRAYLRVKAARGAFDDRMFHYYPNISHNVVDGCKRAVRRAYAAGLVVTSTTGGVHSPTSLHPSGHAVDLGLIESLIGTPAGRNMMVRYQRTEFDAWRAGKRPNMIELIGPDNNLIVLRGRHQALPEGSPLENQHDNHVHQGFSQ